MAFAVRVRGALAVPLGLDRPRSAWGGIRSWSARAGFPCSGGSGGPPTSFDRKVTSSLSPSDFYFIFHIKFSFLSKPNVSPHLLLLPSYTKLLLSLLSVALLFFCGYFQYPTIHLQIDTPCSDKSLVLRNIYCPGLAWYWRAESR